MAEFKGKQGHWVTTESGSHIFIESDGTFEEAVEKAFGKENAGKYKADKDILKNKSGEELEFDDFYKEFYQVNSWDEFFKKYGADEEFTNDDENKKFAKKNNLTDEQFQELENKYQELKKVVPDTKWKDIKKYVKKYGFEEATQELDREIEWGQIDGEIYHIIHDYDKLNLTNEEKNRIKDLVKDESSAQEFKEWLEETDAILDHNLEGAVREVLEKNVEESFDDDNDFENWDDEDDWSKWASDLDKKVPQNWKSDGWDGDTRFYNVKNYKGVESASVKPDGLTTIYTSNGAIDFDNLDLANKFLSAKTKEDALDIAWNRGWLDAHEERAIDDMFGSESNFDSDLERAFKKHKGDENKILDELRKKDYGMSNSDLQGVVESYVLKHGGKSALDFKKRG